MTDYEGLYRDWKVRAERAYQLLSIERNELRRDVEVTRKALSDALGMLIACDSGGHRNKIANLQGEVNRLLEAIHRFSCAPDGGGHAELCEWTGAASFQRANTPTNPVSA